MKKYIKFISCFLIFVILAMSFYRPIDIKASSVSVPMDLSVISKLLFDIGILTEVYSSGKTISAELSDDENKENAEAEQYYLQQMLTYYESYGGDPTKISYMSADGSVVSLEKALQDATSMSVDEYIEMRKQSQNPSPSKSPGIDWGSIFIDNAVGGLMDFVADFLTDKKVETGGAVKPYTTYVGDNGYKNFSDRSVVAFYECDAATSQRIVKFCNYKTYSYPYNNIADNYKSKAFSNYRMAIYLDTSRSEFFDGFGRAPAFVMKTTLTSTGDVAGSTVCGSFTYAFSGSTPTSFTYMSTNMPIFTSVEECNAYLMGGGSSSRVSPPHPFPIIKTTCNNYKNKVVSVNSVRSYGVTPTPKPTATPTPTATSTPSPTPTPTPYPTWDKNSGNGDNFTTYNFYTEISNILNPISTTVTNIYNFFIIDTEEISLEINKINVLPTDKFSNFVTTFGNLKTTFSDDTVDVLEASGSTQRGISYPVLKVESPKILKDYVPDSVKLEQDGKTYIILCDCSKYAVQFSMVRTILKAIMWFGFIFYLMKELKVVISLST